MIYRERTATFIGNRSKIFLVALLITGVFTGRAASLQTFLPVFVKLTNDIARLQSNFDNSLAQKQQLAPGDFYHEVVCRVVDGSQMITFSLPVLTATVRYEIAQGLASLTHNENVFETNAAVLSATNGTIYVQNDRKEVFGTFSASGSGLEVKDGRFRMELPKELRGK